MCHLRHRLRIFLFQRKVMFRSRNMQVFVFFDHTMIYQVCDVMNHNSLTHQTWYKQGHYFSEIFWAIWRTGPSFQAIFNLSSCSYYSITNYVKFALFHFSEGVYKAELKMVNINFQKIDRFCYIVISLRS